MLIITHFFQYLGALLIMIAPLATKQYEGGGSALYSGVQYFTYLILISILVLLPACKV